MEFESETTEALADRVGARVGEVWVVLDRLAVGKRALLDALMVGDEAKAARITAKLGAVDALIADYRELERRSPRATINQGEEQGSDDQRYGVLTGWEAPPTDACTRCGGKGWHPPCRPPMALPVHDLRETDGNNPGVRDGGVHPDAPTGQR